VRAGQIVRIAPDGRIERTIELPALLPTSCTFGGHDLRTLFVTTARQGLTPEHLTAHPASGHLLAIDTGIQGLPEPQFGIH
jgi:sugar lactone lactonase YvrE